MVVAQKHSSQCLSVSKNRYDLSYLALSTAAVSVNRRIVRERVQLRRLARLHDLGELLVVAFSVDVVERISHQLRRRLPGDSRAANAVERAVQLEEFSDDSTVRNPIPTRRCVRNLLNEFDLQ